MLLQPPDSFKGRSLRCFTCRQTYRRAHYVTNRAHTLAVNRAWGDAHPGDAKIRSARWHDENRDHHARLNAAWYQRNREAHLERGRTNYFANRDTRIAQISEWRRLNPERTKAAIERYALRYPERRVAASKQWRKRNPHRVREMAMRRHAAKRQATPPWLAAEQNAAILAFYEAAVLLQIHTGVSYEVDHIVPLRGKMVCGLHVPWNLQILTKRQNCRKGNRYP
jgi:5-methylcytosine-specific restriction endonuclease McrA